MEGRGEIGWEWGTGGGVGVRGMRLVTEKPKNRYQPVPIVFQQSDQSLFQFL